GNNVHLSLSANPSHLEIVDPVVLGKARAKQDQLNDIIERSKVLPLLIHGDDPEAVVFCAKVAIEYRQKFHKPVVIDMFCYRRFGHNEGDEPSFTQPIMYRLIQSHPTTLQIYADKLIGEGIITRGEVDKMRADWRQRLE